MPLPTAMAGIWGFSAICLSVFVTSEGTDGSMFSISIASNCITSIVRSVRETCREAAFFRLWKKNLQTVRLVFFFHGHEHRFVSSARLVGDERTNFDSD